MDDHILILQYHADKATSMYVFPNYNVSSLFNTQMIAVVTPFSRSDFWFLYYILGLLTEKKRYLIDPMLALIQRVTMLSLRQEKRGERELHQLRVNLYLSIISLHSHC